MPSKTATTRSPKIPAKDAKAEVVESVQIHREEPGKMQADARRLELVTKVSRIEIEQKLDALIEKAEKELRDCETEMTKRQRAYRKHVFEGFSRIVKTNKDFATSAKALSGLFGVPLQAEDLFQPLDETKIYAPRDEDETCITVDVPLRMTLRVPMGNTGKGQNVNCDDDQEIDEETGQAYHMADTLEWTYQLSPADLHELGIYREAMRKRDTANETVEELKNRKKNSKKIVDTMEAQALRMQLGADEEGAKLLPLLDTAVEAVISGGDYLALMGGK